jgi:hypothetical protein
MAYINLLVGSGRYDDQSKSTPFLVLTTILASPDLCSHMVILFSDKNKANIVSLKTAIDELPNINLLKQEPKFYSEEGGDELGRTGHSHGVIYGFAFEPATERC